MIGRYDWPALPLAVLVCYSIGTMSLRSVRSFPTRLLVRACAWYALGFVALTAVYVACIAAPGRIGTSERQKVFGENFTGWPSLAVTYQLSPARQFVVRRLQADPDMLLLTGRAGWFHADAAIDQSRVFLLDCNGAPARVTGPARLLILTFDRGAPEQLWAPSGPTGGSAARSQCFERLPNLTLIQRFPDEGLKVIQAEVDGGHEVILKPEALHAAQGS